MTDKANIEEGHDCLLSTSCERLGHEGIPNVTGQSNIVTDPCCVKPSRAIGRPRHIGNNASTSLDRFAVLTMLLGIVQFNQTKLLTVPAGRRASLLNIVRLPDQ